jgi:hypothetical protein
MRQVRMGRVGLVGVAILALSGCAQNRQSVSYDPCDTVTGTAMNYGRTSTLRYAEMNFKSQVPDARGELLGSGLRRVRVGPKRASCRPYAFFGGGTAWTTCQVQAKVCGR